MRRSLRDVLLLVVVAAVGSAGPLVAAQTDDMRAAVKEGSVTFRLTTPDELKKLLGAPNSEARGRDGDMETLVFKYPKIEAGFGRPFENGAFVLYWARINGAQLDIGREKPLKLRGLDDLAKLDQFWGCAGASLAKLDLRSEAARLAKLTFDTLTVWPDQARMPENFHPDKMLLEGRNPGLGVRALHKAGLDGRGVGIAIIDQPLLREHEEFKDALVKYEAIEVTGVPVQMHGPPVASIAVGKTCGVAPGAALYYYAAPAWKWTVNDPWADTLDRIVAFNQGGNASPRIRAISISLGAFSQRPNYERWKASVQKANEAGILVVTCDPDFLKLGTLKRKEDRDGEGADDYIRGLYFHPGADLCVPAGNRVMASYRGTNVFTFDRTGGMSWAVPYLAGLAALGWQVDPSLKPEDVLSLWKSTATSTGVGKVINPTGFIQAIKSRGAQKR